MLVCAMEADGAKRRAGPGVREKLELCVCVRVYVCVWRL